MAVDSGVTPSFINAAFVRRFGREPGDGANGQT